MTIAPFTVDFNSFYKVQALVATLESCVTPLKDFASLLRDTFQACCLHQVHTVILHVQPP